MKNAIVYYYNLNPSDIHQINKQFKFNMDNANYVLMPYERDPNDINYLYELSINLFQKQIYCHQIIPNNNKSTITIINNMPYVLLKTFMDSNDKIILNDLIFFGNNTMNDFNNVLQRDNWGKLWSDKIDYFEYQVNQFGKKYPIIRDSFSYYVGLAETGIILYNNMYNKVNNKFVIAHKRIKKDYTIFDLYNPLNFVIDLKVRDACEFFKQRFFENYDIFSEIKYYISYAGLTNYECIMLYIRMLFPSFYFDEFETIINNNDNEEKLLKFIEKVDEYEQFLKDLYIYIKQMVNVPEIEWLKKT